MNEQSNKQTVSQTDQQGNDNRTCVQVTMSLKLMNYLFKKEKDISDPEKYTKGQAYYDLLTKQNLAAVTDDPSFLTRGIKNLADDWQWNRETVARFVNQLIRLKVAETFTVDGKTAVIITNVEGIPPLPTEIQEAILNSRGENSRPDAENHHDDALQTNRSVKLS